MKRNSTCRKCGMGVSVRLVATKCKVCRKRKLVALSLNKKGE